MIHKRALCLLLAAVILQNVRAVNITGKVSDYDGNGIEGVIVKLCKAGLSTVSAPNGSFRLTGTHNITIPSVSQHDFGNCSAFSLNNGRIVIHQTHIVQVTITIYDGCGRCLSSGVHHLTEGSRSITLSRFASGLHICRVSANGSTYLFKTVTGTSKHENQRTILLKPVPRRHLIKASTMENDALLFFANGYRLYRLPIANTDTSDIIVHMLPFETGIITDVDGNSYKTIQYGSQVWTVENLRTTAFNDMTKIPHVTDNSIWSELTTPAYSFYENATDTSEQRKWGALYNWYTVNTGKLAPSGWHIASPEEWDTLLQFLTINGYDHDGSINENKVAKAISSVTDWLPSTAIGSPGMDTTFNNSSGFSGYPNGYRDYYGESHYRNWYAFWWTMAETDPVKAGIIGLSYYAINLQHSTFGKMYGLPVRMVKDY